MDTASTFDSILSFCQPDYKDDGIALVDDLRKVDMNRGLLYLSDMVMLIVVRKGRLSLSVDGQIREVGPEHLLFCRLGHSFGFATYTDDFAGHAVFISMRLGQKILAVAGNIWSSLMQVDTNPVLPLPEASQQLLRTYYSLLKQEVARPGNAYYSEVVESITVAMLCSMISDIMQSGFLVSDGRAEGQTQALALFQRFMCLLNSEMCTERKIDYYAQKLCVTGKYLSSVCKRVSNRTAHQWIRDSIVNGIRNELRYSDRSIKEIAVSYGFPNVSFFSKYVKEHLGQSPQAYRNK